MRTVLALSLLGLAAILAVVAYPGPLYGDPSGGVPGARLLGVTDTQTPDVTLVHKRFYRSSPAFYGGYSLGYPYGGFLYSTPSGNFTYGTRVYRSYPAGTKVCTWNGYAYVCSYTDEYVY